MTAVLLQDMPRGPHWLDVDVTFGGSLAIDGRQKMKTDGHLQRDVSADRVGVR